MNVVFNKYSERDYDAVCDFLMELSKDHRNHINWNWDRFEWMYEHPEFELNDPPEIVHNSTKSGNGALEAYTGRGKQ